MNDEYVFNSNVASIIQELLFLNEKVPFVIGNVVNRGMLINPH